MPDNQFQALSEKIDSFRTDVKDDFTEVKGQIRDLYEKRGVDGLVLEHRLSNLERSEEIRNSASTKRVTTTTAIVGFFMTGVGWLISFFTGVHHRP